MCVKNAFLLLNLNRRLRACSFGETLSRLTGKVSDCDVALSKSTIEKLLTRHKVFPLSVKVVFIWEKHYSV